VTPKRLGDVASVFNGKTPSTNEQRSGGHPVLKIRDVTDDGKFSGTFNSFVDIEFAKRFSDKWIRTGDTLILNAAHNSDYVGSKAYLAETAVSGALPTGEWLVVRPIATKANKRFVHHWLMSKDVRRQIKDRVKGIHLYPRDVAELPIWFPSITDQDRIASMLDIADGICRKRAAMLDEAGLYLRSVYMHLFGDPVSNSKGLPEVAIAELATVTTGNTPPREVAAYFGDHIEWIKSDNINTPSHFLTKATEGLSEAGLRVGRSVPAGSTLITCIAGSPSCIGNAALADRQVSFNQQINALTPKHGIEPEFIYATTLFSKERIQAGSTNGMKGMVSKGTLQEIPFILPPPDQREKFAAIFRKVMNMTTRLNSVARESNMLYGSLAQHAFQVVNTGS